MTNREVNKMPADDYNNGIDSILTGCFEENIGELSQKLANELNRVVTIEYTIGPDIKAVKSYSPEKHSEAEPGSDNRNAALLVNTLGHYLSFARKDQYFTLLNKILTIPENETDEHSCAELFYSVLIVLLEYINSQKLTEKISECISLYNLTQYDEQRSLNETGDYIRELSKVVFESIHEQEKLRARKIIDMLIHFIHNNLHEDLSLLRLSELAHYNSTYLSRLFKQETGVNLSDYILKARIDTAKELLADGKLKINKVASRVGYESSHSFARTFKNITGISPQDYKNNMSSER